MSRGELRTLPGAPGADLVAAVEALLFAAGEPVTEPQLAAALELEDVEPVRVALAALGRACGGRGVELAEVAGGWQLRTDPRFAGPVLRLLGGRPARLSPAALQVLAVVAYRQPVTRSEVEELRGVDSGGVIKGLVDRGLLRTRGRRAVPGRPLQYATTPKFLETFGLPDLTALPTLAEREELGAGE